MRHIIAISGKDSAATALVQMAHEPDLPYEYIFCDVRMELPETYEWIEKVEKVLGIRIIRIGKSLEEVIAEQNMLPSFNRRFCTKYGKIFPIRDYIGKEQAIQYFGIRADESERVGVFESKNIEFRYPLIDMGIGINGVYQILGHRGILPPNFFWDRLHKEVISRNPFLETTASRLNAWDYSAIFSWRSRSNCFNCFYQRQYEWVGLLEHHPELFEKAEKIEYDYGYGPDRPCDKPFSWIEDIPLSALRGKSELIFNSRVKSVTRMLSNASQGKLFGDEFDPMTVTSCGLYCGK